MSHESREGATRPHVLLVDDQAVIVDVTRRVLEYSGLEVTAYTSSEDALRVFLDDPGRFDIAITDRDMPGLDGSHLATHLWGLRPQLPVLFVSAMDDAVVFDAGAPVGPYRELFKPYDTSKLVQELMGLLNERT